MEFISAPLLTYWEANVDEMVLLALQVYPPQRVSYSYQRMKLKCFSSALCLDLICTDNVIKIHQMSALVRSNASHFRASGDPSDLVYAVLLLYIGPALNSPWRRAYQEQTHISPSSPKCICGRWVSTKTSICALWHINMQCQHLLAKKALEVQY